MASTHRPAATRRPEAARTPAVRFARWGGVLSTSAGIVGLGLTGIDDLTRRSGQLLLGVEVNGLQNLLHLVAGLALVAASAASPETAHAATIAAAAAFGVLGLLGWSVVGTEGNALALNEAANTVHLLAAATATACAVAATRPRARR